MRSQSREKRRLASSCLSVCLSIRPHGTTRLPLDGVSWNCIYEGFSKIYPWKFKFHWNLTRIIGSLLGDQCDFLIISRSFVLGMRNVPDRFVEKIKTHVSCVRTFFFFRKSCRLLGNVEKYCRAPGHSWQYGVCNIYCFSTGEMVALARLSVTCVLYLCCCVCFLFGTTGFTAVA